jgi:hypothetical protein
MSDACPCIPPIEGWCMSMRLWGSEKRLPGAPAHSKNWPIEAAIPTQIVRTSQLTYCMVS